MLKDLLEYTKVADQRILYTFQASGKHLPEALRLFSHMATSHHIWLSRLRGEPAIYERFDDLQLAEISELMDRNYGELKQVIEQADLSGLLLYRNSTGQEFSNVISDVLLHLFNHSTYHRAQIAREFRQNGVEPPATDYIVYKRKGGL